MSLVSIPPVSIPTFRTYGGVGITNNQINAANERVCSLFRVPKTGNLTRFEAYTAAVGVAPVNGQRFSFQDVNASGVPDGIVDQFAIVPQGSVAVGWTNPGDFDSPRAVTAGDYLACVVDIPTFTAGDNFSMASVGSQWGLPYVVSVLTTKSASSMIMALRYDDGTYAYIAPDFWGKNGPNGVFDIDLNTTPDEAGLLFSLPYDARIQGALLNISLASTVSSDFIVTVYDAADTVLVTYTFDATANISSSDVYPIFFYTPITITAGSLYRITISPTSTNDVDIMYSPFFSLDLMEDTTGLPTWCSTVRTNAGAWTDYNNGTDGYRLTRFGLIIDQIDFSGSGGLTEVSNVF